VEEHGWSLLTAEIIDRSLDFPPQIVVEQDNMVGRQMRASSRVIRSNRLVSMKSIDE
jgi:hypothetical protein